MPRADSPTTSSAPGSFLWEAAAPALFVILWSSGFVAGKLGLADVEPLTFLTLRFALVTAIMLSASLVIRAPWPDAREAGHIAAVGVLMHGCYLGGVFTALFLGLPAGLIALIVGLQPVVTAVVAGPFLGEKVSARQWLGLLLGLAGVIAVLGDRYGFRGMKIGAGPLICGLLALAGVTAGTLYQKRFCADANLWTGSVIQYGAALVPVAILSLAFETGRVVWTAPFTGALAWLALVLSIGTVSLLYLLIRRGAVSKVASLFFLTPPTTALMAWVMFDEVLGLLAWAGMATAAVGVALARKG